MHTSRGGKAPRGGKAWPGRPRKTMPGPNPPHPPQSLPGYEEAITPVQSPNHSNHRTPQTAPSDRRASASKGRSFISSFPSSSDLGKSFSTPSPATSNKKRARTSELADVGANDEPEDSNKKGGHSLRKRARIDYSFEYVDDELGGRGKTQIGPIPRGRKRKTDIVDDDADHDAVGHIQRRRATENWRSDHSPRRKQHARKTAPEPKSYGELADEKAVLDTIEVGGRGQIDEPPSEPQTDGALKHEAESENPLRDPSPTPKEARPDRFVVGIPLPASLMTGTADLGLGLELLTKSPHLFAEPAPKTKDAAPEDAPALRVEADVPARLGEESGPAEKPDAPRQEESVAGANISVPREYEGAGAAGSTPHEGENITKTGAQSTAPPELERVATPTRESPERSWVAGQARSNSAPAHDITRQEPVSSGPTVTPGRPWKEFEDLNATAGGDREALAEEKVVLPDAEAVEAVKDAVAPETAEPMASAGLAEPTGSFKPAETVMPAVSAVLADTTVSTGPAETAEQETEHESVGEPKHELKPETEPEPDQSPVVDVAVEAKQSETPELTDKGSQPAPPAEQGASFHMEDRLPHGSEVHTITIETEKTAEIFENEPPPSPVKPWSHLTPHISGQWTLHPESRVPQARQAGNLFNGDSSPSLIKPPANGEPTANGDDGDIHHEGDEDDDHTESRAVSPRIGTPALGSPVRGMSHATAPSSPAAHDDDDAAEEAQDETPDVPPKTQRFYKYPRLRDPDEFGDVIQHYKEMPMDDLFNMCSFVDKTLLALQEEYLMLSTIVDDFENVERRRAHDEAYEQLERRGDRVSRKTFVLKGYRAAMTEEEKDTAYLRHQDRIQAAAYGFRYDSHQAKVGKQDPILQRLPHSGADGAPRRTLRSDPLRSAKATEAADEVPAVPGKRIRKPRELFEPTTASSRNTTPVPTVSRRRRGKAADAEEEDGHANGAEQNGHLVNGTSTHASSSTQIDKVKRGRKREDNATSKVGVEGHDQEGSMLPPPPPKRVRRATTKAQLAAEEHMTDHEPRSTTSAAAPAPAESVVQSVESPPKKQQRIVTLKTKAKSFRALAAALSAEPDEERPTSSSSSADSGASSGATDDWPYRPGKRRRTRDRDDGEGMVHGSKMEGVVAHKPKRARKVTKKAEESVADNTLQLPSIHDRVPEYQGQHNNNSSSIVNNNSAGGGAPLQVPPHPKPRIKVVKSVSGAAASSSGHHANGATVAAAAAAAPTTTTAMREEPQKKKVKKSAAAKAKKLEEAQGDLSAQEYAALSKSEKMSHSMKSRWASGSMQQAVDKRKATLAKKKAAKVAAGGPGTEAEAGISPARSEGGREGPRGGSMAAEGKMVGTKEGAVGRGKV